PLAVFYIKIAVYGMRDIPIGGALTIVVKIYVLKNKNLSTCRIHCWIEMDECTICQLSKGWLFQLWGKTWQKSSTWVYFSGCGYDFCVELTGRPQGSPP